MNFYESILPKSVNLVKGGSILIERNNLYIIRISFHIPIKDINERFPIK
jgi:hypothetical protein